MQDLPWRALRLAALSAPALVLLAAQAPAPSTVEAVPRVAAAEVLPGGPDCAGCHGELVQRTTAQHKGLRAAPCAGCHVPAAGEGACRSAASQRWALAASEVALCTKCHTQVLANRGAKHAPIAKGSCSACHRTHGSGKESLLKTAPVAELCYGCHERLDDGAWVHAPLNAGECMGCHDPHAGRDEPLLAGARQAICTRCHDPAQEATGRSKHAPVRAGHCAECHLPHEGPAKGLLKATGRALCVSCHDASKPLVRGAAMRRLDLTRKHVHDPVAKGDCQACHTQKHGSEHEGLLARPALESCSGCHEKFEAKHKYVHGAVKLGDCAVCHDAHASDEPALVADGAPNAICFRCHENDATGRKWVHAVLKKEGCVACHDPHGGDNRSILSRGEGPKACLGCHPEIGKDVKTPHEAIARAGCDGCHDPHGSNEAKGLHQPVNRLCASCHSTIGPEHVGSFAGKHVLSGIPDRRRGGEEFSCVSCHRPHGSDSPKLLLAGSTPSEACRQCH